MTRLAPRTQRRILFGALLVVSCLAAVLAISSLGSSSSPTILNTEKVEQAIADSSLAQRDAVAQRIHLVMRQRCTPLGDLQ